MPKYILRYLKERVKDSELKYNYPKYVSYIDRILESANEEYKERISHNGFKHLIWYYHKGKN